MNKCMIFSLIDKFASIVTPNCRVDLVAVVRILLDFGFK